MALPTPLPPAEALAVIGDYGLEELGPDHLPLGEVLTRFGTERSWWISTTRPDGRPHAMPVWGLWIDERLIFSTGPDSIKGRNLATNQAVVAHLESGDRVAIVEGTAHHLKPAEVPNGFSAAYETKYGFAVDPTDPAFGIYEILPTKVFSWDEAHFVETAARWRFGPADPPA